ncbi:hypothetical protein [Cecembia rubra]|uniref:Uncharacterized protein n=1 Tax=Cecembia rubra TaxID=1485585 RepID=A0A2P8E664_9BACT|nr:hypothetical protein [Cecembia rubra]PSL04962.1 hypothetical protein CLV48_104136 [Cecembia rubra]
MLTKSQVKRILEKLPEEFSLDELLEKLILIQKVERGLKDSNENKIISEEDLKEIIVNPLVESITGVIPSKTDAEVKSEYEAYLRKKYD